MTNWRTAAAHAAVLVALLAASEAGTAQRAPAKPSQPTQLEARIDSFRDIVWRPGDNFFQSPGPVRITLTGLQPQETLVLTAEDAEGTPDGEIVVRGRLTLRRRDALLSGSALRLNAVTGTGTLRQADAQMGAIRLSGSDLAMAPNGALVARHARLTTCGLSRPHYQVLAREIRVARTGKVVAHNLAVRLGGRTVLVIPYVEKTFSGKVQSPFPLPGYSKETGPKYRFSSEVLATSRSALRYDLSVSTRRAPYGSLSYERDLGRPTPDLQPPTVRQEAMAYPLAEAVDVFPEIGESPVPYRQHPTTLFATAGSNEFIYHRTRTDLRLSRTPEVGLVTYGFPSPRPDPDGQQPAGPLRGAAYFGELSGGYYRENTTGVSDSRAMLRIGGVAPALQVAPALVLRAGMDWRGALYGSGERYMVLIPQAELVWRVGRGTALSAAGLHRVPGGTTPFVFDRLDTRNELRLRYHGDYARWSLGLQVAYDADRWRAYDTAISAVHKLDCMEFGLSYRTRSQGLGIVLNLLTGDLHQHDSDGRTTP